MEEKHLIKGFKRVEWLVLRGNSGINDRVILTLTLTLFALSTAVVWELQCTLKRVLYKLFCGSNITVLGIG